MCHVLMRMHLPRLLLVVPLLAFAACGDDSESSETTAPGSTSAAGSETGTSQPGSETGNTPTTGEPGTTGEPPTTTGDDPTTGEVPTTGGEGSTGEATTGGESSTGEVPTTGPGVLPGETGLDSFCRRYFECGGTYYSDQQECMDASTDYWGECAEVTEALDNFGGCMAELACDEYNPDTYNPANTPCSDSWSEVQDAGPC